MKINPNSSVPDILYLDEESIQDALSYMEGGTINEVIERVQSNEEGEGFSKILSDRVANRDITESETDFVRKLDPIGKLAILRTILSNENLLIDLENPLEEELKNRNMLESSMNIRQTPVDEMESFFSQAKLFSDKYAEYFDTEQDDLDMIDEAHQMMSTLNRGNDIFRANSSKLSDREFVLPHDSDNFRKKPMGFPRANSGYTVLIQLVHVFDSDDDKIPLIDFVDLASRAEENPRKRKRKEQEIKRDFANQASKLAGRDVKPSEFEISAPDIEANLYAIYR